MDDYSAAGLESVEKTRLIRQPPGLSVIPFALVLLAGVLSAADLAELESRLARSEGVDRIEVLSDLAFATARSDPAASLGHGNRLLALATDMEHPSGMALAHNHLGLAYRYLGRYQNALEHALESLRLREEDGSHDGLAVACSNLGILYWRLEDHVRAAEYLERAVELRRTHDPPAALAPSLNNLALVYLSRGSLERALECSREVLEIVQNSGSRRNLDRYLGNLAEIQLTMGRPDAALASAHRSLELKHANGDEAGLSAVLYVIGRAHRLRGHLTRARDALDDALEHAIEHDNLISQKEIHLALSELEGEAGRPAEALAHHRRFADLRAQLFSEERARRIESLQTAFELEQKEHEIALLKSEQNLRELEIIRQRNIRNLLAALLAVTLGLGGAGVALYRIAARTQAAAAVDAERVRIARELHDSLAQDFTGIMMQIDAARLRASSSAEETAATHDEIKAIARQGLADIRGVVSKLRTEANVGGGSLVKQVERLAATTSRRSPIDIDVRLTGVPTPLTPEVRYALTRVCQEALTNIERHSLATSAEVHLRFEATAVAMTVIDNGRGGVVEEVGGFGLTSMTERVDQIGGTLVIDSPPGQGTCITVVV